MANVLNAISAYNKAQGLKGDFGISQINTSGDQPNFANMVEDILSSTVNDIRKAESVSNMSAKGQASIEDLAIAVANAELSLKSLVAIRDKIVAAYQDIIRMPI
ncbi:MAG TPA: hypothetical protein DIV86_01020 [Alphaproteobacteria bacterium]|nr:hypothetical protein [Alphaproteobacteria bacterium]